MHIYKIYKDGTDEPMCRATAEMQTYKTDLWTWTGERKERVRRMERVARKHVQ